MDGVAVGTGFAEIVNNRVTLLVDTAERPEEIDIRRAEEAKERAEEQLRQKRVWKNTTQIRWRSQEPCQGLE